MLVLLLRLPKELASKQASKFTHWCLVLHERSRAGRTRRALALALALAFALALALAIALVCRGVAQSCCAEVVVAAAVRLEKLIGRRILD